MEYNLTKPNIFLYGACDLHDIVNNDLLHRDFKVVNSVIDNRDPTSMEFDKMSFPVNGTSIISLYTKPGPIAQRVQETLLAGKNRDVITNLPAYKEIVKFPYLEFYKKYAGPKDYLVISFSSELYTKFVSGNECFSCLPVMKNIFEETNVLNWLYKEFISKEEFLLPFDTKESLEWSFDLMVDFAKDIYDIFQDRVILVKTHFSNFAIATDLKVKKVHVSPKELIFYRQTKVVTDPTDYKYADRLSTIIMHKFMHHYKTDLPVVKLDEPVFLDSNHKWGLSQFHVDKNSRHKIAKRIHDSIIEHSNKYVWTTK
jgi:hypothetical protein